MNKLIFFPGQLNNVFILNEMPYLKNSFDEIVVYCYKRQKREDKKIAEAYGLKAHYIRNISVYSIIKSLKELFFSKRYEKEFIRYCTDNEFNLQKYIYAYIYLNYAINAERVYKKYDLDVDNYIYSYWMSRGAFAAAYIALNYNQKNIFTRAHRYDLYEERNRLHYLPFREDIYSAMKYIFFISEHGREYYMKKYNKDDSKLRTMYLGTFNNKNMKKNLKDKKKICIASCSNIIHVKRLDYIINILSQLKVKIRWIHIGQGKLFREMHQLAKKRFSNSENDYLFLGYVANSNILKTYYEYDVDYFINLSDSEGIPVSMMETISMGIPVIGRNVGGVSELIDSSCGLLLEGSNINRWKDLIETYISTRLVDINQYKKISEQCLIKWNDKYNAKRNLSDFFEAIKR